MINLRIKRVMRFAPSERKYRLFRAMWERGEPGKEGGGYSAKVAVSLVPRVARVAVHKYCWRLALLGVELHYMRSYGGCYA